MVREQFIGSLVRAVLHRAVGRQQPRVRQFQDEPQRLYVVTQRHPVSGRLKADRGGDVRQYVVPGEEHRADRVVKDQVPTGMPGGVDGPQLTAPHIEGRAVLDPCVRVFPFLRTWPFPAFGA